MTPFKFRITSTLRSSILNDLRRRHPFAYERVGFLFAKEGAGEGERLILASSYVPVADEHYIDEPGAGAWINADAIRLARQRALTDRIGVFHVHVHDHRGMPHPSAIDESEMAKVVPSFATLVPSRMHGAVVLSETRAHVVAWDAANNKFVAPRKVAFVGFPLTVWSPE